MEEATTRFSQTSVPGSSEQARQELIVHQEEKRGSCQLKISTPGIKLLKYNYVCLCFCIAEILESSMHTLSQGQALLDRIKQTGLHTKTTTHATTAACYGIEKMLEKLQDRRRQLEQMWSQRKSYLEQGFHLCQLDLEIQKVGCLDNCLV